MYFITIKRMLEVCFSAHPNIQYRASLFLFHRKLRPMKQKTLREDAHSREAETCRKRPRSARECAKAHSFL